MAKRKNDIEDSQRKQPDDAEDNFGLPDIEYAPIDRTEIETSSAIVDEPVPKVESTVYHEEYREQEVTEPEQEHVDYLEDEEEPSSKAPIIITLLIIIVVAAAGFLVWKYVYIPKVEREKKELAKKENDARIKKEADAKIAAEQAAAEQKRLAAEAAAKAIPAVGTIETLSDRTQRFYVVIASDIDGDLIMDYAKRLSAKGVSTKIVPPFGKTKYSRLTMGDYDSFASAQSGAEAAKAEYGSSLWVIKY